MEYKAKLPFSKKIILPDFLCIGAQKAGTTWLYENLKAHSQIFLPEKKELHFFDCEPVSTLRSYSDNFKSSQKHQIVGEITPAYSALDENKVKRISQVLPSVKLILIIRNPIERAWSHAVMNLITQSGRSFSEVQEEEFINHFNSHASISRSDYMNCIDTYLKFFQPEQLLIVFYEEISINPQGLLNKVFKYLGVDIPSNWDKFPYQKLIHQSAKIKIPDELYHHLKNQYKDVIGQVSLRFGSHSLKW